MRLAGLIAVGWLALFGWRAGEFLRVTGPTFDEGLRLVAGVSYWQSGDFRLNREDPPLVKLLFALPVVLTEEFRFDKAEPFWSAGADWQVARANVLTLTPESFERMLFKARLVHLAFGVGVVVLVGWWAYRLFGVMGGLVAMGFAALDPTLLAMSCLLSLDVPLTFFLTLLFYLLWEYRRNPSNGLFLSMGVAMGLALATKLTAVMGVAIFFAVVAFDAWRGRKFGPVARLVLVALVTLALSYGVVHFPLWGAGLKQQLVRSGAGNRGYLLGEVYTQGRLMYYPVAIALKVPIGTLLAIAVGGRYRPRLAVVALLYLAALTYTGVNLGVRLALPSLVLLFVVAGATARYRVVAVSLLALAALQTQRQSPHFLTYFNSGGSEYLADSNLDWGQDLPALKEYLDREGVEVCYLSYFGTTPPELYGIRSETLPGYGRFAPPSNERVPDDGRQIVAVSVNNLLGIYLDDRDAFGFLRGRGPLTVINHAIAVYDLTGDADAVERVRGLSRR